MLQPGTYKLLTDVVNPKPDRRRKYDWRAEAVWEAGTEFLVENDSTEGAPFRTIQRVGEKRKLTEWGSTREQFLAVFKSLVAIEESVDAQCTRLGIESNFVKWLVTNNKLSRTDLEQFWNTYWNEE